MTGWAGMTRPADTTDHIERLRGLFNEEVPALVVSTVVNIRYLLGRPTLFDADFSGLLLVGPEVAALIADSRYSAQAEAAGLPCRIEGMDGSSWETLGSLVKRAKLKKVGFEAQNLTVSQWQQLKNCVPAELAPAKDLVERLRLVKNASEIDSQAAAARIADEVFNDILNLLKPGVAEREIALEIDFKMRRAGAERAGFDTIVAGGPNSAFPHAGAGERKVGLGDFVKLDFGAVFNGYHSDMTRTVVLGNASSRQKEVYANVVKAQQLALDGLAPGIKGREADALARNFFASIGTAENFGHNLGHGVGLDIHEQPTLGPKSESVLEVGMVFTVEPGLYFPGFGGVRIEDMIVLREHGIQILTASAKELIEL